MALIRLVSTDFDGTIVGFGSEGRCAESLAEALLDHHKQGGLWAINTGRSLAHAVEGVAKLFAPVPPDFLLTNEREVFRNESGEWVAYGSWNSLCTERHADLFGRSLQLFDRIEAALRRRTGVRLIVENRVPAGLVTPDEATMEAVAAEIREIAADLSEFSFQRNSIYLRFCHADYDKGSALAELCRLEGIAVDEVFAAGDHHNDLPMLHPDRAGFSACPANAIPEVKQSVLASGGYVSSLEDGEGVADALAACRS